MGSTLPTNATLKKYGITIDQWSDLIENQDRRCWICRKSFSRSRLPCVDHRHTDGLVRGLLCTPCNRRVGEMHDSVSWFATAAEYLRICPAVDVIGKVYIPDSRGASSEHDPEQ